MVLSVSEITLSFAIHQSDIHSILIVMRGCILSLAYNVQQTMQTIGMQTI